MRAINTTHIIGRTLPKMTVNPQIVMSGRTDFHKRPIFVHSKARIDPYRETSQFDPLEEGN